MNDMLRTIKMLLNHRYLTSLPPDWRAMIELLAIWAVLDAVSMRIYLSAYRDELKMFVMLLAVTSQLTVAILWSAYGNGRWSTRWFAPIGFLLAMIGLAGHEVRWPIKACFTQWALLWHAMGAIFVVFGCINSRVDFRFSATAPTSPQLQWQLTLLDLLRVTALVAMLCVVARNVQANTWNDDSAVSSAGLQVLLIPATIFMLHASLQQNRWLAYCSHVGIPLALFDTLLIGSDKTLIL